MKNKILVVLGPTATGKSDLAVKLAKKFNGEIISADSRQVYKGLDIGTGKVTKKEMCGVPHYMLDVITPKKIYSVSDWQKQTEKIIKEIQSKNKLPIICGGTGFYIQSIVENIVLPKVEPNQKLRKKLEEFSTEKLFEMLKKLDEERSRKIDKNNRVRLIRAIEIAKTLGKVPSINKKEGKFEILEIGLTIENEELKEKIKNRLLIRIKKGMIEEVRKLHKSGLSWKRMFQLGLEYKFISLFLQKKLKKDEMIEKLNSEIWHYAKRQITWFKRDKNIKWFRPQDYNFINKTVSDFIK